MNYKLNRNLNNIVNNLTKLAEDIFRMYSNKQNVLDKSGIFLNTFIDFMLLIKNVTTSFKNNKEKEKTFYKFISNSFKNEYVLALERDARYKRKERILDYSVSHTVYLINYCINIVFKYINRREHNYFNQESIDYLNNPREELTKLKFSKDPNIIMFYQNARRSETYLFQRDFYINMITTRTAIEGFTKYIYKHYNINGYTQLTASMNKLIKMKIYPNEYLSETIAAISRGNNNVHRGHSGHFFAAKHNVELLKILQQILINLVNK